MGNHLHLLFLLVLALLSQECDSWGWFQSFEDTLNENPSETLYISKGSVVEFSMEALNDRKGVKLVENARQKLLSTNTCWQNAYQSLFAGCSEIIAAEEKRSRLAWHLANCFQKDSGRPAFPSCDSKSTMKRCLTNLDEDARKIYLEFYLETNSICHQLQTNAFKLETERLVNELKNSAQFTEDKLNIIEERSETLLQGSNQIYDSLTSIDLQTQQVAQTSKKVEDHINIVLKHSEAIYEQVNDSLTSIDLRTQQVAQTSKKAEDHIDVVLKHSEAIYEQAEGIAASQTELQVGQVKLKEKLEEGMTMLHESYNNLGQEINSLRKEAVEIEKEINKVGDTVSSKMQNLQNKADDIGNMAGISLDKQRELLDGQSIALDGLQFLTKFQSQALEESRGVLQQLVELGREQQEELLQRQGQLQQAHDRLVENSKSILAAQEAFESKQEILFIALDKLFTMHNAMLIESRLIKAFLVYSLSIFIIFMFTSSKQTYTMRPRLYIGLCMTFFIEFTILRMTINIEQQTWIINLVRTLFALLSLAQLLHAIYTYRDYEVLNHQILLTIMEKINRMKQKEVSWDEDSDNEVNWSKWVDKELTEDVDYIEDPDYLLPEEVGENSIILAPRKYDLRQRSRSSSCHRC